jgi:glycogen synthase
MKVLMTADAVGGVWTYVHELSRALGVHDVEAVVATMGPRPSSAQIRELESAGNVTLVHGDYKLEWMEQPWDDVARAGDWLLSLAARKHVDLVHLNGYAHALLEWELPLLVVVHSCVCSWWQNVHGTPAPAQWDRYRTTVTRALAAASAVVAPSAAFLSEIELLYGRLSRAQVIPNALAGPAPSATTRDRIVLACGRAWDAAKNLRLLDAAAAGLDCPVYLAGDCVSPDGRKCRFNTLQALGALPTAAVHAWMRRAAVFVHPSLYEPFGLAVLEAAQRGCALVLSDVPTLRELWAGAALFADPHDAAAFQAQLRRLLEDPAECSAFASAAAERAAQFHPQSMAQAYDGVYRSILRPHAREEEAAA